MHLGKYKVWGRLGSVREGRIQRSLFRRNHGARRGRAGAGGDVHLGRLHVEGAEVGGASLRGYWCRRAG